MEQKACDVSVISWNYFYICNGTLHSRSVEAPILGPMKEYLRLILALLLPLVVIIGYSLSGYRLLLNGWSLSKLKSPARWVASMGWTADDAGSERKTLDAISPILAGKGKEKADSLASPSRIETPDTVVLDTARKRILFFGDSMVEGLSMRFSDYAMENGHKLFSVCWYGSSIGAWASATDSIKNMLRWAQPDYVVVSLGGNELRATDLDSRREDIYKIQAMLGSRPTVWIAPPSWVKNPTITDVIQSVVGERRYFDSTRLTYTRGSDNMHPTFHSSARWMDSIAVWMSSPHTLHPIVMNPPTRKYPRRWSKRFIFPH